MARGLALVLRLLRMPGDGLLWGLSLLAARIGRNRSLNLLGLFAYVARFIIVWVLVWALQWALAPRWLVGSRAGVQTLLQVVPTAVIALLVLVLGTVVAVAQVTTNAYGTRAALMLAGDPRAQGAVARPLIIAIASVLLAGQIPDSGSPSTATTAAVGTVALATVLIIVGTAAQLPDILLRYTAPVAFARVVLSDIETLLELGQTPLVVFRVPLLGEMLKRSIHRGDSVSTGVALDALRRFYDAYAKAAAQNPGARRHEYDDGETVEGWIGEPLRAALVDAGSAAQVEAVPEHDLDAIAATLGRLAEQAVRAGHAAEARVLIEGLAELGLSIHQVAPSGAVNVYTKNVEALSWVESAAEEAEERELAAAALAMWAMVTSWAQTQYGMPLHPLWFPSLRDMGPDPPFDTAASLIESQDWQGLWVNKMPQGPAPVLDNLEAARSAHPHSRAPSDG